MSLISSVAEPLFCKQVVGSSILSSGSKCGLAQPVEREPVKFDVPGSNPGATANVLR